MATETVRIPRESSAALRLRIPARLLAWLAPVAFTLGACAAPPDAGEPERAFDLVVISLDTVRPDHVGVYGYPRGTTPHLDRLAGRSVVFGRAMAPTPLTGPSHVSVFTGRQPWSQQGHGLRKNGIRLDASVPVLAEILQDAGWQTAAFVSGFPLRDQLSGLARGFDVYDDDVPELRRPGIETVDAALRWWKGSDPGLRRHLFVHLYDAHGPYLASPELVRRFESGERGPWAKKVPQYQRHLDPVTGGIITDLRYYIDRYDAAINATDQQLGRLLDQVDLKRTVVLVMSDHGETLDERTPPLDHGSLLHEEQMRAVAVLSAPGLEPRRVDALVSLADFGPTLLDLLGLAPQALRLPRSDASGRSLRLLIEGRRQGWRSKVALATTASRQVPKQRYLRLDGSDFLAGIVDAEGWKLIVYSGDEPAPELYRLDVDPGETANLADAHPERARRLREQLDAEGDAILHPPKESLVVDPEAEAALRALGYV